jgi:CarD family transcriptional regulator
MASKNHEPVIGDGSLHVGDRVVYPNQGICRITGVETKLISGQSWEVVTLSREEDGATVMVPRAKVMGIGLRKVADVAAIDKVFDELASPSNDPQLDWKVRHRENADRMTGGGLFGTVEVLKGLHALSRVRPLPAKERELYDNARHLLVGEIAAAMDIPLHVAEDNLDYALWPPQGTKRKGVALPPATLGPPTPAVRVAAEDDLGFDDDEAEEATAAPAVAVKEVEADGDDEEEVAGPLPKVAAKKAERHAPAPERHAPEKAHAPPERHTHTPERHAPAAAKEPTAKKAAHPAPAKKAAHPAPAKKAAASKAHPAKKPAGKKPAHGKKPAAKGKPKGKR